MKRAFTLVELLVVIVVIAILASIVFRIAGLGSSSQARNETVARLQCLENAISGYFAVYGSYPPVPLQGRSRNIYHKVNGYGIQQVTEDPDTSKVEWSRVEAACRAQPVAMQFPYSSGMSAYVKIVSDALKKKHDEGIEGFKDNPALAYGFDALDNPEMLSNKNGDQDGIKASDWPNVQLFNFGLMSYLLPRYLVMMGHGSNNIYDKFAQWTENNTLPSRFEDGVQYGSWEDLNRDLARNNEKWKIAALPSQAVTARWMINFKGMLTCNSQQTIYGVDVRLNVVGAGNLDDRISNPKLYSAGNSQGGEGVGGSEQYMLDEITCKDGWFNDFYYYSPPPYQTYRLWSAGPNGKTFPPWIPDEEIEKLQEKNTIRDWLADDIVHMSN